MSTHFGKIAGIFFMASGLIVVLMFAGVCQGQVTSTQAWTLLENGLQQKNSTQRVAAVRVLGLIPHDSHATELAENALNDSKFPVRAAAATALGQMQAKDAAPELKAALDDKSLPVVLAAAHALRLLNDPSCYEVYYALLTGSRKNDSSMVKQEMQIIHDPKKLAAMGVSEGLGYVPFASMGWEAVQTIMKDRRNGTAAKTLLITAMATDPDPRANQVLVIATADHNWVVRAAALEAIAKRGDSSLLPDVEKTLTDSKPQVQYTAAATIVRLSEVAGAQTASTNNRAALPATQSKAESEMARAQH